MTTRDTGIDNSMEIPVVPSKFPYRSASKFFPNLQSKIKLLSGKEADHLDQFSKLNMSFDETQGELQVTTPTANTNFHTHSKINIEKYR